MKSKRATASNPLKMPPIPGMGTPGGGQKPGIPQPPGQQNVQPNFKPSVVAPLAAEQGNKSMAFVQSLFTPQAQQKQSSFMTRLGKLTALQGLNKRAVGPPVAPVAPPSVPNPLSSPSLAPEMPNEMPGKPEDLSAMNLQEDHQPEPGYMQQALSALRGVPYASEAMDWVGNNKPLATGLGLGAAAAGYGAYSLANRKKKRNNLNSFNDIAQELEKESALHAVGDSLPKDWNLTSKSPSKSNGGVPSYGKEAWDSVTRRKGSDKDNFDKSWHTEKGKEKMSWVIDLGKEALSKSYPSRSTRPNAVGRRPSIKPPQMKPRMPRTAGTPALSPSQKRVAAQPGTPMSSGDPFTMGENSPPITNNVGRPPYMPYAPEDGRPSYYAPRTMPGADQTSKEQFPFPLPDSAVKGNGGFMYEKGNQNDAPPMMRMMSE